MISVERFCEPVNYGHWGSPPMTGFIYRNVLDNTLFQSLKKEIRNIINTESKATFLTNALIFQDNDKKVKLGLNPSNGRYQNVLYDLTYDPNYWYQTQDTIYKWAFNLINNQCSPKFIKFLNTIQQVEPFNENKWIPYRLHLNYLCTNECLSLHLDTNPVLYKDIESARTLSLTYYMHNHQSNLGGELFSINGWSFNPQENVAVAINGHHVLHGVTRNMNNEARLAFTTRWIHIEDLFLPGHPDKHLYKIEHL